MRHALAAYLLLVFAIGWVFWAPLVLLYNGSSALQSLRASPVVIVLQTLGAVAPVISAIVVTGLTRGKRGVGQLLGGLKRCVWGLCAVILAFFRVSDLQPRASWSSLRIRQRASD
jgi:hypothetical protein